MEYRVIVAMDENNVIADSTEGIPWRIAEDFNNYKSEVDGELTISGRRTFDEIPEYEGKKHIVLTRNRDWSSEYNNVIVCHSIEEAKNIAERQPEERAYVLGGQNIYSSFLPDVDKMIISHIEGTYEGDIYFPQFDLDNWSVQKTEEYSQFELRRYSRKS